MNRRWQLHRLGRQLNRSNKFADFALADESFQLLDPTSETLDPLDFQPGHEHHDRSSDQQGQYRQDRNSRQ